MWFLPCIKANLDCEKVQDQEVNSETRYPERRVQDKQGEINQPGLEPFHWPGQGLVGFPGKLPPGAGATALQRCVAWPHCVRNGNKASVRSMGTLREVEMQTTNYNTGRLQFPKLPELHSQLWWEGKGRYLRPFTGAQRYFNVVIPLNGGAEKTHPTGSWIQHCFSLCKRVAGSKGPSGK